jgi:predicted amidohydrolase
MRIGHCQLESKTGDFDGNLAKVVKGLEQAERDRVAVLCYPECFLTGYPDRADEARRVAFAVDAPQMMTLLARTAAFDVTFIVGFNEKRGDDLYNSAVVVRRGHLLGRYSKVFAYMPFHKQGRDFPVFERDGVKFGVVICADGGYVEPARILALKGAKIIFSPHYNYISARHLLEHFQTVRADHIARAVENRVYFLRGNSVTVGKETGIVGFEGVGYGDSYLIDPYGEMVVRSRRLREDYFFADIDPGIVDTAWKVGRSRHSARELGRLLLEAAGEAK